jgi:hypothetical protein
MNKNEPFTPESIDEQIDQFSTADGNNQPGARVVQSLQTLYAEQQRLAERVWERLAQQVNALNADIHAIDAFSDVPGERIDPLSRIPHVLPNSEQPTASFPKRDQSPEHRRSRPRKMGKRLTTIAASLVALLLISSLFWMFHGRQGTQAGQGVFTATPSTPVPQSVRDQAHQLLRQFHQEVTNWGQTHQYQDRSNGKAYELDYAYNQQGIGEVLDQMVDKARSTADLQAAIDQIQDELTNLHALESNSTDHTSWNQVHRTDSSLLNHYHLKMGTVVVVSLLEQCMRVYQDGQLIKAFLVTTGRYEVPSLPGSWQVIQHQENVTLISAYPNDSPFWFPPTPVRYLLAYHMGAYRIFDSWWRTNYGPGTNFPHHDTGGNPSADNGSAGSIEVPSDAMAWLYDHVQMHASVVIY